MPKAKIKRKAKAASNVYSEFQRALELVHQKKFSEARVKLEEIRKKYPEELEVLARTGTFLKICDRNLKKSPSIKKMGAQDLFDLGVFKLNAGDYDEATQLLSNALKQSGDNTSHIHYAMAAAELGRGESDSALKNLAKAVELDPESRFVARSDPDFAGLLRHAEFQKLIGSR